MTTLSSHKQKLLEEFTVICRELGITKITNAQIIYDYFSQAMDQTAELTFNEVRPKENVPTGNKEMDVAGEDILHGWNSCRQNIISNYEEYIK